MDIRKLTFFSTCFAFLVVALGAWTRLADAGLGCPDWPGCYGFFTLPTSPEEINLANNRFPATPYEVAKAIPEVFHRFFAAGLGLLIMGIFICIRRNSNADDSMKKISCFLLIWVIFQGVFGYLTVSLKLLPDLQAERLDDRVGLLRSFDSIRRRADSTPMIDALARFNQQALGILLSGKFG